MAGVDDRSAIMDTKPPHLDKKAVLQQRSTKIDRQVVAAHERLEEKLLKLGVEIKPRYSLGNPLGGGLGRVRNNQKR